MYYNYKTCVNLRKKIIRVQYAYVVSCSWRRTKIIIDFSFLTPYPYDHNTRFWILRSAGIRLFDIVIPKTYIVLVLMRSVHGCTQCAVPFCTFGLYAYVQ